MRKLRQLELPFDAGLEEYKIGDVVPFRNTHGNTAMARICEFEEVQSGNIWFRGINVKTEKSVWYPVHLSRKLKSTI
jgi:hypothetical protein